MNGKLLILREGHSLHLIQWLHEVLRTWNVQSGKRFLKPLMDFRKLKQPWWLRMELFRVEGDTKGMIVWWVIQTNIQEQKKYIQEKVYLKQVAIPSPGSWCNLFRQCWSLLLSSEFALQGIGWTKSRPNHYHGSSSTSGSRAPGDTSLRKKPGSSVYLLVVLVRKYLLVVMVRKYLLVVLVRKLALCPNPNQDLGRHLDHRLV